jgi:hypothetical protein
MAIYESSYESRGGLQAHSGNRLERPLRISWSGIVGGTALGWGIFSLLSLIGAAIGFAKFDPYSAQPADGLGAGSGIFGIVVLLVASFLGAYFAVRIAGDRRRSEALMHGGICWAFSMLMGAMLALGAARTAAQSAATVASGPRVQAKAQREANARDRNGGPTATDRDRAEQTADTAAKTSGAAAGGAFLALVAALFGALAAASRSSGKSLKEEFRFGKRQDGHSKTTILTPENMPPSRGDDSMIPRV